MGKETNKKTYVQTFRNEWLKEEKLKDWILKIPTDSSKVRCRYCKCDLNAKHSDLMDHASSKKHTKAAEPFSSNRQTTLNFVPKTDESSQAEASIALYACIHSTFHAAEHLTELTHLAFSDSKVAQQMKMHRTKCSAIIKRVLAPFFQKDLLSDIGDRPFSLLLDESNDISTTKLLGIAIIYYSVSQAKVVSTFLTLVELEACNAVAITTAVLDTLRTLGLNIKNLHGLGTDNASVMTGINNGVYAKLKHSAPNLILIRCTCHSLQLAVCFTVQSVFPRHLEFLVHETYNWFSKSALRQNSYLKLYQTLNDGKEPLKIPQVAATRWLSIERAVDRIVDQWVELKLHFQLAKDSEKCFTAETLFQMYLNDLNLAYLSFLRPILTEVQMVNKSFESNQANPTKLLNDLILLIRSLAQKIILPTCRVDVCQSSIDDYLDPKPYLGFETEKKLEELKKDKKLHMKDEEYFRNKCKDFVLLLIKQIKERLPDNYAILQKTNLLSVSNVLRSVKEPLTPLIQLFNLPDDQITEIEYQFTKINLVQWIELKDTISFWTEVNQYIDASGINPFRKLVDFALTVLVLPYSNAMIERVFSQMNIVKNKVRNRTETEMVNAVLTIRFGCKRVNKCCHNFQFPKEVLMQIRSKEKYDKQVDDTLIDQIVFDLNVQ